MVAVHRKDLHAETLHGDDHLFAQFPRAAEQNSGGGLRQSGTDDVWHDIPLCFFLPGTENQYKIPPGKMSFT